MSLSNLSDWSHIYNILNIPFYCVERELTSID